MPADVDPERRLWAAVLEQAIGDWQAPTEGRGAVKPGVKEDARLWLWGGYPSQQPNSFVAACGYLGLDPEAVRDGLRKRFQVDAEGRPLGQAELRCSGERATG